MKSLFAIILCIALVSVMLSGPVLAAEESINVSGRALNATPLVGPEGIVLAPDGNLYVSERNGKISSVKPDGSVEVFADLSKLQGGTEEKISPIGLALDKEGDIYAATFNFAGGAVIKIVGPGKPDAGQASLYRGGIGSANFVLIDDENGIMYVSDSAMFSGRVFRFDTKDEALIGKPADPEKELIGEFPYANGLALGPDKKYLYVAETVRGQISRINLETIESEVFVKLGGWMDGLLFDPDRELLYACDNRNGKIFAVNFSGETVGVVHLTGKDGQVAPACLIFQDSYTLIVTDLMKASMWRVLLGRPQYHSSIYPVTVGEIAKKYRQTDIMPYIK